MVCPPQTSNHGDPYWRWVFGPPTGKKFVIRAIADCAAINNQINDEWLIRDTAGLLKQLGLEPMQFAKDLIEKRWS